MDLKEIVVSHFWLPGIRCASMRSKIEDTHQWTQRRIPPISQSWTSTYCFNSGHPLIWTIGGCPLLDRRGSLISVIRWLGVRMSPTSPNRWMSRIGRIPVEGRTRWARKGSLTYVSGYRARTRRHDVLMGYPTVGAVVGNNAPGGGSGMKGGVSLDPAFRARKGIRRRRVRRLPRIGLCRRWGHVGERAIRAEEPFLDVVPDRAHRGQALLL